MLRITNLTKNFDGIKAIQNVSLKYDAGIILGIMGPNGSGKTTLLNLLTQKIPTDEGEIIYLGKNLNSLSFSRVARLGIVRSFQEARIFLNLKVLDNLLIAKSNGYEDFFKSIFTNWRKKEKEHRNKAQAVLERVGLEHCKDRYAYELSFGQRRRLEIARVLMQDDASLYLFDEPTGGIDPASIGIITGIFKELKHNGKGIIIVEHNIGVLKEVADRIVVLDEGQVIADGTPREVFGDAIVQEAYLGEHNATENSRA